MCGFDFFMAGFLLPAEFTIMPLILSPLHSVVFAQQQVMTIFTFSWDAPKKGEVWTQVWRPIHFADPDLSSLFQCLRTAHFPGSAQQQRQQASLCACILQAIWSAHWSTIFNNTTFISTAVAAHASHLYSSLSV
ncbi:predicted protein [Lichtheimia corymbifera JMRC:FSU:9682]|uniref:Uncharacterized protein n=1 Tax=Lichtheimia corymbifera JMRC:FSU:9682 TaxID=1263082 RepID=A0A068RV53_9FUNG|nr:predicted protein [Lichtheimia corymbifera JMRC:FSU:9682]